MAEIDIEELAGQVVAAVAQRLPNLAGSAADALVDTVGARLRSTRTGSRALDALRANPAGEPEQELAHAVLGDEMHRDPSFAAAVVQALGRPHGPQTSVTLGAGNVVKGDLAGGNIDKSKRYHIGSIRFGGGGLTALVVIGLLGAGGGGLAAYNGLRTVRDVVQPPLVEARSGSTVMLSGSAYDLDAANLRATARGGDDDGDRIVDVTLGEARISANSGASIAPLQPGVAPSGSACASALDNDAVPTITALKVTDVICVRTSRGSVATLTISDLTAAGQVYTVHHVYFTARS